MAEDSPTSGEGNQAVQAETPHPGAGSHDVLISDVSQDAVIANAGVAALERVLRINPISSDGTENSAGRESATISPT